MASRFQHLMIDSDDDSSDGGSAAAPARTTTFGQKSTTPSASQHSLPLTNNSLRASSHHTSVKNSVQPSPASHQSSSHRAPLFHEEEHEEEEDEPVAPTSFAAEEDEAVLSDAPQETVSATKHRRRRKRSHRRHQDEAPAAPTPLVVSPPTPASVADSDAWRARRPVIPSPSELRSVGPSEGLDEGVRRTFSTDGGARWVLADGREVAPPPERLSRRAQDIMTSRRTVLEKEAATRVRERRMEEVRSRPRSQYIVPSQRFGSLDRSGETNPPGWRNHRYDGQEMPTSLMRDYHDAWESHDEVVSQVVRTLQPIQVNPASASPTICRCVEYAEVGHDEKELQRLLRKDELLEAGFRAYLNLQPMQLAQVEVEELTEPSREGSTVTHRSQSRAPTSGASSGASRINAQRGVATLGGLWCTVEALREDGRPVKAQVNPPRRVVRICGGQPLSLQRPNDGRSCDARCYELLLFPQELSTNSSGVSYGSDGVTLGQMTSPPSASFPLTPRVLADDSVLREYKKKLMSRRQQEIAFQNSEDDAATFATENGVESPAAYLTMTLATISTRAKFTIDLTLVLLPYRALYADGANVLAHLPRFCPQSVGLNRRLQGLSLTFTTRDAFMSAYKALLWATECNMVQLSENMRSTAERRFVDMQVCATASPLHPWRSSFGKVDRGTAKAAAYRGSCIDFAVMALSNGSEVEPLRLDELTFRNAADADAVVAADGTSENGAASSRRSSVVSSASGLMGLGANTAAVGHIPFGVIKRAVHSTTNEVFDVRVVPRARAQLAPIADPRTNRSERSQEQLLDQDVEAAVLLEYATRLPFLSHVRGVLVDEQKYYVVQSPWMSAAALQRSGDLTALSGDVSLPEGLQRYLDRVSLVSLSDFSRAILPSAFSATSREMEGRLQMVQLLIMQLCLLVTNLHGKGLLLGPCPPQRLLVRVEHPDSEPQCAADDTVDGDGDERSTNMSFSQDASSSCPIPCRHVQLFLSDIGMNPNSWSYERQQCGVLEYLSPNYVFGEMLERKAGEESRPWTMHDDWWCVLCLCFELLSGDALFVPSEERSSGPSATPMLSAFSSPFDVLQQWCGLLTPAARKDKSVSESVHVFVRQRVLKSVAPRIDSWISAKLEELKLFGTTSASQRKANATRSSAHGPLFGVSLASAYMHGASGGGESTCPSLAGDAADDGLDNVLRDMAWIFYYREFFDALLDVACPLERIPCSVHVPSAHLLRQPFLLSQNAPQVFDGTLPFPEAAARLLRRRMSTTRVQTLLKNYRNNLHKSGSQRHADASLMISRTPFNRNGRESEHVPLLLLAPSDSRTQGSEGSAAAASSAASERSSRTQQNRLRALYQPCELKDIAEAEDEVRGALHHGGYYAIEAPVEGASTSSTDHPHSHLTSRHSSFYVTEAARVEAARYESSHPRTGAAEESASAPGRDSHRSSGPASVRTPSRHHTQPLSEDTSFSPSPRRGSDFVEIERSLNQMASAGARSLPASPGFRHRPSGLGPEATTPAAAAESTPYHPTSAGERDDRRPPPAHPLSAHSSVRGLPQRSSHGTPRSQA